jgi:hypothetical protein
MVFIKKEKSKWWGEAFFTGLHGPLWDYLIRASDTPLIKRAG